MLRLVAQEAHDQVLRAGGQVQPPAAQRLKPLFVPMCGLQCSNRCAARMQMSMRAVVVTMPLYSSPSAATRVGMLIAHPHDLYHKTLTRKPTPS